MYKTLTIQVPQLPQTDLSGADLQRNPAGGAEEHELTHP